MCCWEEAEGGARGGSDLSPAPAEAAPPLPLPPLEQQPLLILPLPPKASERPQLSSLPPEPLLPTPRGSCCCRCCWE